MPDTLTVLETAIQNHIGTMFPGHHTDSWILVCHSQSIDESEISNYRIVTSEIQPHHIDLGLLEVGKAIARESWDSELYGDSDE